MGDFQLEIVHSGCMISSVKGLIERSGYRQQVVRALEGNTIAVILGPRQCGKTTLARSFVAADSANYFDLEDPVSAHLLSEPMTALSGLRGLVVIDEAQRQPGIFPVLRVLADRENHPAKFLILGSASPELSRQASESLAGRVEVIEMGGFNLGELGMECMDKLWLRGGFPRSFLASDEESSDRWRREFIRTFLERDLAQLGFGMSPALMRRFWVMASHYHGQVWNSTEVAASIGIAPNTARSYLDALTQTFMILQLQPWHANIGKRQVKSPKLYLRDSGLFHRLQGISGRDSLMTHPKLGASWEGFAIGEILRATEPDEAYFWAVHSGSELDLLLFRGGRRTGVEFKRSDSPKLTRSMSIAIADLGLDELYVVYPGQRHYELSEKAKVIPFSGIHGI